MLAQFFLLSCLSILVFIASPCTHLAELAENFHVRKQLRRENSCGHGMKSCAPSSSPSLFSASVLVASDSDTCPDDRLSDDVRRLVLSSMFQRVGGAFAENSYVESTSCRSEERPLFEPDRTRGGTAFLTKFVPQLSSPLLRPPPSFSSSPPPRHPWSWSTDTPLQLPRGRIYRNSTLRRTRRLCPRRVTVSLSLSSREAWTTTLARRRRTGDRQNVRPSPTRRTQREKQKTATRMSKSSSPNLTSTRRREK